MSSCCKATYHGQTQRHFFVKGSEDLHTAPGKFVKMPKKSAIFIIFYWMVIKLFLTISQ